VTAISSSRLGKKSSGDCKQPLSSHNAQLTLPSSILMLGLELGEIDALGWSLGGLLGDDDGNLAFVGWLLGISLGKSLGILLGYADGNDDNAAVGSGLGMRLGGPVVVTSSASFSLSSPSSPVTADDLSSSAATVGRIVGGFVNNGDGDSVGTVEVGRCEGINDGTSDGISDARRTPNGIVGKDDGRWDGIRDGTSDGTSDKN
jgi:hypothetical protein